MELFNDKTMNVLSKALDATLLRHEAISNNIANINTKGYKSNKVIFEEKLKAALADVNQDGASYEAIKEVEPELVKDNSTSMRLDGNNVDIDLENANLAANQLMYDALVQRLSGKLSTMQYIITGGGR